MLGEQGEVWVLDFDRGRLRAPGAWSGRGARSPRAQPREVRGRRGRLASRFRAPAHSRTTREARCTTSTTSSSTSRRPSPSWCSCGAACAIRATARGSASVSASVPAIPGATIWIHAVSVGEVQAAQPLIDAAAEAPPEVRDPAHYRHADRRAPAHGCCSATVCTCATCRFDLPGSVRRFFDRVRPKLAMILETELWPNLYGECGRRGVPLVLASARISPRSVGKYRRMVAAVSQDALARHRDRGPERVGRRTLPVDRRHVRPDPRHRQHQVRLPAA